MSNLNPRTTREIGHSNIVFALTKGSKHGFGPYVLILNTLYFTREILKTCPLGPNLFSRSRCDCNIYCAKKSASFFVSDSWRIVPTIFSGGFNTAEVFCVTQCTDSGNCVDDSQLSVHGNTVNNDLRLTNAEQRTEPRTNFLSRNFKH